MSDRKKPGVAVWATVVVACQLLYPISFGPACWINSRSEALEIWETSDRTYYLLSDTLGVVEVASIHRHRDRVVYECGRRLRTFCGHSHRRAGCAFIPRACTGQSSAVTRPDISSSHNRTYAPTSAVRPIELQRDVE